MAKRGATAPPRERSFALLIVCGLVYLFLIAPMIVVVSTSFTKTAYVVFPPEGFTLHWFAVAFSSQAFLKSMVLSLELAVLSTLCTLVLGIASALALGRWQFGGRDFLVSFFLSPILVPTVVYAIALLQFFAAFRMLGTFTSLLIAHTVLGLAYAMRILVPATVGINTVMEEAAMVLGATRLQALWRVVLPLMRGGIAAASIFAFVVSLDEVVMVIFIGGAQTITFPLRLYSYMAERFDPVVSVYSSLFVVVAVAVVFALARTVGLETVTGGPE